MNHQFNVKDAENYGVEAAVILQNIKFWLDKEKANWEGGKRDTVKARDGYVWTYNSARAFKILFPYFSEKKIQRLLRKLEDAGAIISGNYNKISYDKTKWYTTVDYAIDESLGQICPMDRSKASDGSLKSVQPIPDINTDKKPYDITSSNNDARKKELELHQSIIDQYNNSLGDHFTYARKLNKHRVKLLKNIIKEYPPFKETGKWVELFDMISQSWLMKNNGTDGGFKVGIDWILTEKNFTKIIEGTYN